MIARWARGCAAYQDALLDFVDRRSGGLEVEAALRHLDRCPVCERELAATAVVLAALHRLWAESRTVEPPSDAWPRLRARVVRRPARRWQPGTVAGLVAGAGLVVALVAPVGMRLAPTGLIADTDPAVSPAASPLVAPMAGRLSAIRDGRTTTVRVAQAGAADRTGDEAATLAAAGVAQGGSVPSLYPDNVRPATTAQRPLAGTQRAGRPIQSR